MILTLSMVLDTAALTKWHAARIELPKDRGELMVHEIGAYVRLPQPLLLTLVPIPNFVPISPATGLTQVPWVGNQLPIVLHRDGTISMAPFIKRSIAPALDSAELAALDTLGVEHAFLLTLDGLGVDSLPLLLSLYLTPEEWPPEPAIVGPARAPDAKPLTDWSRPVSKIRLPAYSYTPAQVIDGTLPSPRYPEVARLVRIEETVLVQFRVDENGRIDARDSKLLQGRYQGFLTAVGESLKQARFRPASVNGCAISALLAQPFVFKLAR